MKQNKCVSKIFDWLDCIVNYWKNLSVDSVNEVDEHKQNMDNLEKDCILCLNPIAKSQIKNVNYYAISDSVVCRKCSDSVATSKVTYLTLLYCVVDVCV